MFSITNMVGRKDRVKAFIILANGVPFLSTEQLLRPHKTRHSCCTLYNISNRVTYLGSGGNIEAQAGASWELYCSRMNTFPLWRGSDDKLQFEGVAVALRVDYEDVLGKGGQGVVFRGEIFDDRGTLVLKVCEWEEDLFGIYSTLNLAACVF